MFMEKKVIKVYSDLFKRECTLIHDPELDKLKGKIWAPKKVEEIDKILRKIKSLPK
jgi:hypothetical protein